MNRLPFVDRTRLGDAIRAAAEVVAAGGVVAVPTETSYGLAADCRNRAAVERVYELKRRPRDLPLPVLCADWDQLESLVEVPRAFRVKLSRIWPAPLTVVLRASRPLPVSGGPTIAVRIPGHAALRALLYRTGPLTGTSANRHGEPPPADLEAVEAALDPGPDLGLDGGRCTAGAASTIVDLSRLEPAVLRPGPIDWNEAYPLPDNELPE